MSEQLAIYIENIEWQIGKMLDGIETLSDAELRYCGRRTRSSRCGGCSITA